MYKSNILTLQETVGIYGYKMQLKKVDKKRQKNLEKARQLPEISNSEALEIIKQLAQFQVKKKDIA
jgi:hypothetical protein